MKILFVGTNLPMPANSGQGIRSLSIIQALQSMGHELSFVSFAPRELPNNLDSFRARFHSMDLVEKEVVNMTADGNYLSRLVALLGLKCFSLERFKCGAMRERIQRMLAERQYDLLVSDGIFAMTNIPENKVPIALNCHNVEHIILRRYAQVETNPAKKLYAVLESLLLRSGERRCCVQSSVVLACSQLDLEILRSLYPGIRGFVVPNVIDTELVRPTEEPSESSRPVLLFQGGMDWYPNRDAVEYFVRDILPRVRTQYPEVRLIAAGRNPPPRFVERFKSDSGVHFTGTVPDMGPYLAMASVVIVPLRVGGGTRIKILEACAGGKPIVSTRIGAEGLELKPGKEIVLCDDPMEFAEAIAELLHNPVRAKAMSVAARAVVLEHYGPAALRQSLEHVFSGLSSIS
jgi:glycosyltransferase involved in cell wall biosynthesis